MVTRQGRAVLLGLLGMGIVFGCGGPTSVPGSATYPAVFASYPVSNGSPTPTGTGVTNALSNTTTTDGVTISVGTPTATASGLPPVTSQFKVKGLRSIASGAEGSADWTSESIQTDTVLRVDLSAHALGTVDSSGFQIMFQCLQLDVQALGATSTVLLSTVGPILTGPCAGAQSIVSLDYSARLTSGHGGVNVKLTNPRTDSCYTRYLNGLGFSYVNCALGQAFHTHNFTGTLITHMNGTF